MKQNFIKTTVQRLADLSWPELRDIFSWSSNGTIQAENEHLLVAKATDERGDVVAYVTAESVLLVDSYTLNPQINLDEARSAGDAIDKALAEKAGASRLFVVIPNEAPPMKGEQFLRVFERKVSQNAPKISVKSETRSSVQYLN